ncbi:NUDIX hydrolase [Paenibacillus curdlanolyticus YK9]|uniref:NUDIX hydrolase n=1 Tax=Paenibacillus curdlanolyticus YK9 TaxID=717606 RepID=E0I6C9_9BACL|nr:NUDIX hydrolase [Paenibacillus curdlanolyticus]EFM11595.1 NUDIX hydrolase [Paenibacillus curdlanolyticus YK9]
MRNHPNYRIAVEIVILHESKVLLTKRAEHVEVGPGEWCVPSGKVKYEEIPIEAMYREAMEETNLEVELIKELDQRTFKGRSTVEEIYRLVFTYLVKPKLDQIDRLAINDEHSEYVWVTKEELNDSKFESLHPTLRRLLVELH